MILGQDLSFKHPSWFAYMIRYVILHGCMLWFCTLYRLDEVHAVIAFIVSMSFFHGVGFVSIKTSSSLLVLFSIQIKIILFKI